MRRGLPKEMSLDSPISLSMLFHARASKANRFWSEQPGRLADIGTFSCSSDLGPWVCIAFVGQMSWRCGRNPFVPMTFHVFLAEQITNLLGTFAGVGACKHMFGSWFFCVVLSRCGNPVWECWAPKCLSGLWAKIVKAALDVMDLAPSGTKLERGKEVMTRYLQLQEFSIMCCSWTHVCKTGMEGIGW